MRERRAGGAAEAHHPKGLPTGPGAGGGGGGGGGGGPTGPAPPPCAPLPPPPCHPPARPPPPPLCPRNRARGRQHPPLHATALGCRLQARSCCGGQPPARHAPVPPARGCTPGAVCARGAGGWGGGRVRRVGDAHLFVSPPSPRRVRTSSGQPSPTHHPPHPTNHQAQRSPGAPRSPAVPCGTAPALPPPLPCAAPGCRASDDTPQAGGSPPARTAGAGAREGGGSASERSRGVRWGVGVTSGTCAGGGWRLLARTRTRLCLLRLWSVVIHHLLMLLAQALAFSPGG